jgi:hypothetical protein
MPRANSAIKSNLSLFFRSLTEVIQDGGCPAGTHGNIAPAICSLNAAWRISDSQQNQQKSQAEVVRQVHGYQPQAKQQRLGDRQHFGRERIYILKMHV